MPEHNTKDIEDLGRRFKACKPAVEWARKECADANAIWKKGTDEQVLWIATRPGVLTDAELRDFAEWCLKNAPADEAMQQRVIRALANPKSLNYPEGMTAERWAALAMVCCGRLPGKSREQSDKVKASNLRKLNPKPFVD